MDPLSIPNVTTAVLEQLFRVGDRTADFLSNFKDYDAVSWLCLLIHFKQITLTIHRTGRIQRHWNKNLEMRITAPEHCRCFYLSHLQLVLPQTPLYLSGLKLIS